MQRDQSFDELPRLLHVKRGVVVVGGVMPNISQYFRFLIKSNAFSNKQVTRIENLSHVPKMLCFLNIYALHAKGRDVGVRSLAKLLNREDAEFFSFWEAVTSKSTNMGVIAYSRLFMNGLFLPSLTWPHI